MIDKLKKNEELALSPGEQNRDFIYIKDFVMTVDLIIHSYKTVLGNIINISYGKGVSIRSVAEFLYEKLESSSGILFWSNPLLGE